MPKKPLNKRRTDFGNRKDVTTDEIIKGLMPLKPKNKPRPKPRPRPK